MYGVIFQGPRPYFATHWLRNVVTEDGVHVAGHSVSEVGIQCPFCVSSYNKNRCTTVEGHGVKSSRDKFDLTANSVCAGRESVRQSSVLLRCACK